MQADGLLRAKASHIQTPVAGIYMLPPSQNVTAFGESVFKEAVKFKQGHILAPIQKD